MPISTDGLLPYSLQQVCSVRPLKGLKAESSSGFCSYPEHSLGNSHPLGLGSYVV